MIFEIKQGDELLTNHSGLALIGVLLQGTKIEERLNAVDMPKHPYPDITHGTIAKSMIGLLSLGKPVEPVNSVIRRSKATCIWSASLP